MIIKFKRSPIGFGYSHRAGSIATSLPDEDCKKLIAAGVAEEVIEKKEKPKKAEVVDTKVKKAQVKTADVKRKYNKK